MESPCITVYKQGCEFPFFFFFPLGKKIGKFVEKNAILRRGRNNSSGGRGANMTGIYENENQNSSPYLLLLFFFNRIWPARDHGNQYLHDIIISYFGYFVLFSVSSKFSSSLYVVELYNTFFLYL
uniref:Uncharacterized protein n=1 Tax=Cacopsylla melanoneura TaxID=428564 RepID=A0A8D8T7G5_9HEMI